MTDIRAILIQSTLGISTYDPKMKNIIINLDQAEAQIKEWIKTEIIDAEIPNWTNGASAKERFIRQMQIDQLRQEQKGRLE